MAKAAAAPTAATTSSLPTLMREAAPVNEAGAEGVVTLVALAETLGVMLAEATCWIWPSVICLMAGVTVGVTCWT